MIGFFSSIFRPFFEAYAISDDFSPTDFPLGEYEVLSKEMVHSGYRLSVMKSGSGDVYNKIYKKDPEIKKGKCVVKGQKFGIYRTDIKQGRWLEARIL